MEIYRKIASGVADSLSVRNPIEIFKSTIDIPADVVVGDTLNLISAATFTVNNLKGSTVNAYAAIFNGPVLFKNGQSIDFNFTPGSIIFAGPSGVLSENNSYFYWNNSSKYFGVGTNSPTSPITFSANIGTPPAPSSSNFMHWIANDGGTIARITYDTFGSGGNITYRRASGTMLIPTALLTNEQIGALTWFGYMGAAGYTTTNRAGLLVSAAENWSATVNGTYMSFYTTPIGGVTSVEQMRISGDSILIYNQLKVSDSIISVKTIYGVAGVIGALYGG